MPDRFRTFVVAAATALLLPAPLGTAASRNFVPDLVFTGSTLTGWKPFGDADWRAQNGEIVGVPKGGGWLVADRAYQDVAFSASFRCAEGCRAGVLLRAERTAGRRPQGHLRVARGRRPRLLSRHDRQRRERKPPASVSVPRAAARCASRLHRLPHPRPRPLLPAPAAAPEAVALDLNPCRCPAASSRRSLGRSPASSRVSGTTSSSCSMPTSSARFSTTPVA